MFEGLLIGLQVLAVFALAIAIPITGAVALYVWISFVEAIYEVIKLIKGSRV